MILKIYTIFLRIILFFLKKISPYLKRRFKRINDGYDEYFGRVSVNFKKKDNVCLVHGVSIGEINCGKIFIERLNREDINKFLVTSTCPEAIEMAKNIEGVETAYFPIDLPEHYDELFNRVNIVAIYIMEVDIWPNLVIKAWEYKIPIILVNGRVSPKTFGFYSWLPQFSEEIFNRLKIAFVQTERDRNYLIKLGMNCQKIVVSGNIKFDFKRKTKDISRSDLQKINFIDSKKPILIGGSTHEGEEKLLIEVVKFLLKNGKKEYENILLILVPRDINRADEILELSKKNGKNGVKWSELSEELPEVVVIDKFGILTDLYEKSDLIFIGGSTGKIGGHSIIEGIIAKKILVTGKDMRNFQEITDLVIKKGCGLMSEDYHEIGKFILDNLDRYETNDIGKKFDEILLENVGSVDRIATYLKGRWSLFKKI